jgi:hypothetical protein
MVMPSFIYSSIYELIYMDILMPSFIYSSIYELIYMDILYPTRFN